MLVQLGLLDPNELPVAGVESARKALDRSLPANALIELHGVSRIGRTERSGPPRRFDPVAEPDRPSGNIFGKPPRWESWKSVNGCDLSHEIPHERQTPCPLREGVILGGGVTSAVIDEFVRILRERTTNAERILWEKLRRKQIEGLRFRRQYKLGRCIVDFVCLPARLIIEVDGGQHAIDKARDDKRTAWLESQDFTVIRFWNNEVLGNIDGVMETIHRHLPGTNRYPSPCPLPQGEGEVIRTSSPALCRVGGGRRRRS
ncbi:MAG TPA: DUF559 domain-containing protein [Ferrovibrio sp.]|uniref:endonuclease domain-containing protein n=1 Tax=Ferrovibrio sp. TaxID=1917215 RepID=UPI002ECFB933